MDAYCRTCSVVGDHRVFTLNTVSQISNVPIEDMLIYCTQLEISSEDSLPQQICSNCFMALNSAFEFRQLCYKSDHAFRETLQTVQTTEMEIEPKLDESNITDQCPTGATIKQECLELDEFTISMIDDVPNCPESDNVPTTNHLPMQKEAQKKFSCKLCDFVTDSVLPFRRHKHIKFPNLFKKMTEKVKIRTVYKCGECRFQNYSITKLKSHHASKGHTKVTAYRGVLKRQLERKPYTCPYCEAQFNYKENIQTHIQVACRAVHGNPDQMAEPKTESAPQPQVPTITPPVSVKFRPEYRCSKCKRTFLAGPACSRHELSDECSTAASKSLPYRCDFCNYKSARKMNLYRHQVARCKAGVYLDETLEPQLIFNYTLKNVYSDPQAIQELKLESGEPIFPAEYSTYESDDTISTYRPPVQLVKSIEEYEYFLVVKMLGLRCCACSMFFLDSSSLAEHLLAVHLSVMCRTITTDTTQPCENCRLPFYRTDGFNYHKQLEQINRLLFCTTCEEMVIGNTAWLAHCNAHHGKKNLDDSYEKVFVGEKFRCCNCDALKATLEELESHQMEEHFPERQRHPKAFEYECDKCFKTFRTIDQWERHMEVRTAKKLYRCGMCHEEFLLEKDAIAHRDSNEKCKAQCL